MVMKLILYVCHFSDSPHGSALVSPLFDPDGRFGKAVFNAIGKAGDQLAQIPLIGSLLGGVLQTLAGIGKASLGLLTFDPTTISSGAAMTGRGLLDFGTFAGQVWGAPNTAIGLTLGLAGMLFGGDFPTIGHNGIQFANNPLMFRNGDITFGNAMNFGAPHTDANGQSLATGPDDPLFPGSPW
jgi:hypothetical protein